MNRDLRPYTLLLGLSWTLAVSIVGGLVVGVMFDRFMGTSPIGLLVFSLIGILAASLQVYRQVSAAIAAEEEEHRRRKRDSELRKRDSGLKSDSSETRSDSEQKEED